MNEAPPLRRRFLSVGERRVHYLRAGEGPPALLVHSSPANAWLLEPEIKRLAREWTVFAFDTPGFGASDPLPQAEMTVADLADALADTLAASAMPPCPMFGSHTGAAIALEFGVRHPERVTGLVLDGVPAFTPEEIATLFGDYLRPFPPDDLGGQYTPVWTRFRDQSVWFPWSRRTPESLNAYDLGAPESTHMWASMYWEAAAHYAPAYRAALGYGPRALEAAAALERPAIYTATDTDMLHPHMARLPPLKPGQEIRGVGRSYEAKRELIAEGFARFGAQGPAPADPQALAASGRVERRFVDRADGGQTHLRHAGDPAAPALVLIHDSPGSSARLEARIAVLAADRFVVAPDLPGAGGSDALEGAPDARLMAAAVAEALAELGMARAEVVGIGLGACVALELARAEPARVTVLGLEGAPLPTPAERAELRRRYAPPIPIEADGAHWYRTWLMLRDSLVWFPWFDRREAAQRLVASDFDAARLHRWTVDVVRRRETYAQPILAAFDHDTGAALRGLDVPLVRLVGGETPWSAHDARMAALAPQAPERPAGAGLGAPELQEAA